MSSPDMDAVLDVMDDALDDRLVDAALAPEPDPDPAPLDGLLPDVTDPLDAGAPVGDAAPLAADAVPPPVLELRILSGLHAGARAPLQGQAYLLGALDDCDIVLGDAGVQPHHARLSRREMAGGQEGAAAWQIDWLAQEDGEPTHLPTRMARGRAVPLGPVVVAVDEPGAPWPTLEQLVLVPHAPALAPGLPPPREPLTPGGSGLRARFQAVSPRRVAVGLTVATLGLSAAAAALVVWPVALTGDTPAAAGAANAPQAQPTAPDPTQRLAIEAALAGRGLAGRARIEPAGAAWQVRAPVLNDLDAEALSAALARLQPRPLLRLPTEQELRDEVTAALPGLAGANAGAVRLRALGPGRFRLEGRMAQAAERDALLRAVADAFPQAQWEHAVHTPEEAADALLAELRGRGWQAGGEWKDGVLQLQVTLQQRDVPQWEQTLLALAPGHDVPLRAAMTFAPGTPTPAPVASGAQAQLPFHVRGVVGGDMPYVLLADGDKLALGGVRKGWRLATVSASQVMFENGAQRVALTR